MRILRGRGLEEIQGFSAEIIFHSGLLVYFLVCVLNEIHKINGGALFSCLFVFFFPSQRWSCIWWSRGRPKISSSVASVNFPLTFRWNKLSLQSSFFFSIYLLFDAIAFMLTSVKTTAEFWPTKKSLDMNGSWRRRQLAWLFYVFF